MKKLLLKILLLCIAICLVICVFTACDGDNSVTVTFDTQGGSKIAPITIMKGEKINRPEDPIKEGYEIVGWYIDGEEWSFIGFAVTKDIVLTVKWDTVNYTIDYNLRGGENSPDNPIVYTIESELTLAPPQKDDYVFMGWDNGGIIEKGSTGTKTFTANWESYRNVLNVKKNTITGLTEYGSSLNTIVIPERINGETITSIGKNAFENDNSLTVITMGNNLKDIGDYAFKNCRLLASVIVPDSVTSIGGFAFWGCISLTNVTIGSGVSIIGEWAFRECTSILNITVSTKNEYYKSIEGNLYNNDGTTLIQYAIGKTITSFVISNSVTNIGNYAFTGCAYITIITIPANVTKIGWIAFAKCDSLNCITFENTNSWWVTDSLSETNGDSVDVTNAYHNATLLKETYMYRYWFCG